MLRPTVTICSDASYSPKYNIGTWACYIRTPYQTIQKSGVLKQAVYNSYEAERMGLVNALFLLDRACDLSQYKLIVYCDNIGALNKKKITKTPLSKHYEPMKAKADWYKDNIEPYLNKAADYDLRHVKAHLDKSKWDINSQRNYLNDWCDKEAKRIRIAEIDRINNPVDKALDTV